MKTFNTLLRKALMALPVAVTLAAPAHAIPPVQVPDRPPTIMYASGNCHAIGMQHAARSGGQLLRATPEIRGGQTVCVIVVAEPAREGQRPRRTEIVVPAG